LLHNLVSNLCFGKLFVLKVSFCGVRHHGGQIDGKIEKKNELKVEKEKSGVRNSFQKIRCWFRNLEFSFPSRAYFLDLPKFHFELSHEKIIITRSSLVDFLLYKVEYSVVAKKPLATVGKWLPLFQRHHILRYVMLCH